MLLNIWTALIIFTEVILDRAFGSVKNSQELETDISSQTLQQTKHKTSLLSKIFTFAFQGWKHEIFRICINNKKKLVVFTAAAASYFSLEQMKWSWVVKKWRKNSKFSIGRKNKLSFSELWLFFIFQQKNHRKASVRERKREEEEKHNKKNYNKSIHMEAFLVFLQLDLKI